MIQVSKFRELSARLSYHCMLPSLSPARTDCGADYLFYNPFTSRFISDSEALVVLRGMDRRVTSCHPVGSDYYEIDEDFSGQTRTSPVYVRH